MKARKETFLVPLYQTPSRRIAFLVVAHARDSKVSLLAGYQLRDHLSHPQHAVPKKINEIRESLNMFGKLNENVINIEYFSPLILIENLVLHAAFCSMSWFKDMRHRQSTPSEYLLLRIVFIFRLFLEQHMQLHRRKTPKLSLGILVKKGNYEITLFLPQE